MLFNENNPYYYINGARQSCTTPIDALCVIADNCPDCKEITKTLANTYEEQEKQLKQQEKELDELTQAIEALKEEYASLYVVMQGLENNFNDLLQTRRGTKAHETLEKAIRLVIYDVQTSL